MAQPPPIQTQSCDGCAHYIRSSSSLTRDVNERKIANSLIDKLDQGKFPKSRHLGQLVPVPKTGLRGDLTL